MDAAIKKFISHIPGNIILTASASLPQLIGES